MSHLPSPDKDLVLIEKLICKKTFDPENQWGYILKSGSAKQ